jgi:hypothetical protein
MLVFRFDLLAQCKVDWHVFWFKVNVNLFYYMSKYRILVVQSAVTYIKFLVWVSIR